MIRTLVVSSVLVTMFACRPSPFRVDSLSIKEPPRIEAGDPRLADNLALHLDAALAERYRQKHQPSFALINGYYRLPETKPYGAAMVVRSYSYQTYVEGISVASSPRDAAISPLSGDEAVSLEGAFNALLKAGVLIKEISMTDALAIANAERDAFSSDHVFVASKVLPPDVDYLISIYPATSKQGPVLIGRVIKRDGTLMAFRVMYNFGSDQMIGKLVLSLFEDTLSRL